MEFSLQMQKKRQGVAILGSTGSGKTAISIGLAQKFGGEIISCDSMQIYKGMAIGTAQPSESEQSSAVYHLVDCFEIDQAYNASMFIDLARDKMSEIYSRSHLPIVAGGTGMYASFFMYGHDQFPSDPKVKEELRLIYDQGGLSILLEELAQRDSISFSTHQHNWRRALRALEICRITGKTLVESRVGQTKPLGADFDQFILMYSPEKLRDRIRIRCQQMIDEGWVEEAEALFNQGLMNSPTAQQAIGYPLIHEFLFPVQRPENQKHLNIPTREALVDRVVIKTAQYAKQQRAWFKKRHSDATFIEMDGLSKSEAMDYISSRVSF